MQRITNKDLERLAGRFNMEFDRLPKPYGNNSGKPGANIGNFHISYAYGGACLHEITNSGGAVKCPIQQYHSPKRELYEKMHAFLDGVDYARRIK